MNWPNVYLFVKTFAKQQIIFSINLHIIMISFVIFYTKNWCKLSKCRYRTCSPTNRARLLTALVYKPRDLLHKIYFLTALKTLDTTYKQRLVDERIRYLVRLVLILISCLILKSCVGRSYKSLLKKEVLQYISDDCLHFPCYKYLVGL